MDVGIIKTEYGIIRISDKVIAEIAKDACLGVPGVAQMDARFNEVIPSVITGEDAVGVQVSVDENVIHAELYFTAYHGQRMPDLALAVQKAVKNKLKDEIGLAVSHVDVNIQDVVFQKESGHDE